MRLLVLFYGFMSCQSYDSKESPIVEITPTGFSVSTQQRIKGFELKKADDIYIQQDFLEPLYEYKNTFIFQFS